MPTTQDPATQTNPVNPQGQQPVTNGGVNPPVGDGQQVQKKEEPDLDVNFDLDFSQNDPSMGGMPPSTTQNPVPASTEQTPVSPATATPGTSLEEPNLDINFDVEPDLTVDESSAQTTVQSPVQEPAQPQQPPVQSQQVPAPTESTQNVVKEATPTDVEEPNLDINFDVEPDLTVDKTLTQTTVQAPVQEQTQPESVQEPTQPQQPSVQPEPTQNVVEEVIPTDTGEQNEDINLDNEDDDTQNTQEENVVEDDTSDENDDDESDDFDDETGLLSSYYKFEDLYEKIVSITGESQYQMTHSETGTNYVLTKKEDGLEIVRSDDNGSKTLSFDDSMGLTVNYNGEEILDFDEGDDETEEVTVIKNKIAQFIKELDNNYQSLQTENESNKKGELLEEVKNF